MNTGSESYLIKNATIVNEGTSFRGDVLIEAGLIAGVFRHDEPEGAETNNAPRPEVRATHMVDASGLLLLPGLIDDQVHFREPGLTHKGDIGTESRAGVAGGVTSFMEMPNTIPQTTTLEHLEEKYVLAGRTSPANYAFYLGATNHNLQELLRADPRKVCGIKIFMGASTGDMLVDDRNVLEQIFAGTPLPVAVHCEDETIIREHVRLHREQYGENVPVRCHPLIRSEEACYRSSALAVELATKYGTRLHLLHLSTARELSLLSRGSDVRKKKITGEVCIHHLWFNDSAYDTLGALIKWNPAIKTEKDRQALLEAVRNDTLDIVATDHAPHTLQEKQNPYFTCPSGGPLLQFSLQAMLDLCRRGEFTIQQLVTKMCHAPADLFDIEKRGYIREGYFADLVLVHPDQPYTVTSGNILSRCGWSPFEGHTFGSTVTHTWVNGNLAFSNGKLHEVPSGKRITFNR